MASVPRYNVLRSSTCNYRQVHKTAVCCGAQKHALERPQGQTFGISNIALHLATLSTVSSLLAPAAFAQYSVADDAPTPASSEVVVPLGKKAARLGVPNREALGNLVKAADRLSKQTGRLLKIKDGDNDYQIVEVASRMSEDAQALANEAVTLASLDSVAEAERNLVMQIHEAAMLVSRIAQEIAAQEQARLLDSPQL